MKTNARVVIIGGGIAGCSLLYHLTEEGWTDIVLVERDELTSGTTWHSAAQVTNFGAVQTMIGLKSHSIKLYKEMADDPDYPINYHHADGGLRFATTPNHIDGYKHFIGMAKGMGVDFELLDPAECKRRHPLIETHELLGALWDPLDGDIDPAQLTQALARRARKAGAEVYRHTAVTGLTQAANDEWTVHTTKGDITCEMVVNACGYRVNEVGAMMGVQHPVMSMEHQYFLTEPIPELESLGHRVPLIRDPLDDFYSRQEKFGLLVGIYEQDCKTWGMDGIDPDFANALCPDDLDRCLDNMDRVFERMPCLMETGIHSIINGPITYSADGLPLVGRIPGKRNAYCIIGLRAGLGEGGGHGKILAEIMVHGQSEWDTWCLDPRRFTQYANTEYTALKAIEDYRNEFRFHMPHEFRPAGRIAKTTSLYSTLKDQGAEFGVVAGWERALFFKPSADYVVDCSFRFHAIENIIAAEVQAVHERVGLMEVSGFNRFEISGPRAGEWLDSLSCSNIPKTVGRLALTYSLTESGHVLGEATLAKLAEDRFWYGSAAASEAHDWDMLNDHLPDHGVTLHNRTRSDTILVVAGPRSRELLNKVAPRTDWSSGAFKWLTAKPVFIGHAEAMAMRVSFSGELGWELHIPNEQLYLVHQILNQAGAEFGLANFGLFATESMRLEKCYRHWKADLITEYDPFESSLDRFVNLDKPDFPGKKALLDRIEKGRQRKFVPLIVDGDVAPAHAGDPIYDGDKLIGTVTSGGFGHRIGQNIALAFVETACADINTKLEIGIIGERCRATVVSEPIFDPANERVRG